MLYPIYLHIGDRSHAHGVTIPDFPGCFSAADSWEELPHVVQEAAELYFEGEDMEIPDPTPLEKLAQDPAYHGGVWMLVDIDVSKLRRSSRSISSTAPSLLKSSEDHPQTVQEPGETYQHDLDDDVGPKIEVMLPDDLLKIVDDYAARHNLTRSAVLARAAINLMTKTGR